MAGRIGRARSVSWSSGSEFASMRGSVVISDDSLQALTRKGADVEAVFAKLAMDTAARAALNIRAVGAIDTSYMVNTTAARHVDTGSRFTWTIGTAAFYGVFIEYGTRFVGARPWLTPAMVWAKSQVDELLRAHLRV